MEKNKIGVLLINIGTPDHPTLPAVRRYLKEFLSDRRVVEMPRAVWLPILYGFILPFRAKKSARFYQKIWTENGSPLLCHSQQLRIALEKKLEISVELGMRYGKPSIQNALENLKKKNIGKILILPLYPQYSAATTASTFDHVARVLKTWRVIPEIRMIWDYADDPLYINALAESIREQQRDHKAERIVFSFHGIPESFIQKGDPYQKRCELTVSLLAEKLGLNMNEYLMAFQSRLGRAKWLRPYTDKTLQKLPKEKIKDIQIICPGFTVDCLETLEEIAIRGKQQFLNRGGERFQYIEALNNREDHVDMLEGLVQKNVMGW
ncbi:MAG TPA: ferrochelatase [Gammaproteobacteria bacterium]|nr:ferrochelatase [Gammaproteobacteria bacterium]